MDTTLQSAPMGGARLIREDRPILNPLTGAPVRLNFSPYDASGARLASPVELTRMLAGSDEGERRKGAGEDALARHAPIAQQRGPHWNFLKRHKLLEDIVKIPGTAGNIK